MIRRSLLEIMNYSSELKYGTDMLEKAAVPDAALDARLLLEEAAAIDHSHFLLMKGEQVDPRVHESYEEMLRQRAERIPLQQITGYTEFMGLRFLVNKDVLCPRQDTETLSECALRYIEHFSERPKVLDLCTGSGCIAISIDKLSDSYVTACDISEPALDLARKNAALNLASVSFCQGDLFGALPEGKAFDLIVSNPPYIRTGDIAGLMPEVKDHEPLNALDGSSDGLLFYRRIIGDSRDFLCPGGAIMLEIGFDQADQVEEIARGHGFTDIRTIKDLAGNDRVVIIRTGI